MKIKNIIYLLGSGNSGSTVIAKALASSINGVNLGEVSNMQNWIVRDEYCGCGNKMSKCDFWEPIISCADYTKIGFISTTKDPALTREAINSLLRIYEYAAEVTGSDIVIDASKNSKVFYYLWKFSNYKLIPVYILRAPIDYVHSCRKRNIGQFKAIAKWIRHNLNTLFAIKKSRSKKFVKFIIFDDFIDNPQLVIKSLFGNASIVYDKDLVLGADHSIAGTKSKSTMSSVNPKFKYRVKSSYYDKLLCNIFGANLLYIVIKKYFRYD